MQLTKGRINQDIPYSTSEAHSIAERDGLSEAGAGKDTLHHRHAHDHHRNAQEREEDSPPDDGSVMSLDKLKEVDVADVMAQGGAILVHHHNKCSPISIILILINDKS